MKAAKKKGIIDFQGQMLLQGKIINNRSIIMIMIIIFNWKAE